MVEQPRASSSAGGALEQRVSRAASRGGFAVPVSTKCLDLELKILSLSYAGGLLVEELRLRP